MLRFGALVLGTAALLGAACAGVEPEDGEHDTFLADGKVDAFGVADKTSQAFGILRLVNEADRVLLDEHDVPGRAASEILERRAGADRVLGTHDDREITSLTQLDGIAWVGPITFERLHAATRARGYLEPFGTDHPAAPRVVVIGDIHGDADAARRALGLAGAIDIHDRWIGGQLVVVQAGDLLDREDGEREILDLFDRLVVDARASGGSFVRILGNHELMNAQGDFRYVTDAGFAAFEDVTARDPADPRIAALPRRERGRAAAFLQGGEYAVRLASSDIVAKIGDTLVVHGGLTRAHVTYGLERLNYEARAFLSWDDLATPAILDADDGPVWTRDLGDDEVTDCDALGRTLDAAGARRLVIAHTVQDEGITSACGGTLWRIDVGMSSAYGGALQLLEIDGTSVHVLGE